MVLSFVHGLLENP